MMKAGAALSLWHYQPSENLVAVRYWLGCQPKSAGGLPAGAASPMNTPINPPGSGFHRSKRGDEGALLLRSRLLRVLEAARQNLRRSAERRYISRLTSGLWATRPGWEKIAPQNWAGRASWFAASHYRFCGVASWAPIRS